MSSEFTSEYIYAKNSENSTYESDLKFKKLVDASFEIEKICDLIDRSESLSFGKAKIISERLRDIAKSMVRCGDV